MKWNIKKVYFHCWMLWVHMWHGWLNAAINARNSRYRYYHHHCRRYRNEIFMRFGLGINWITGKVKKEKNKDEVSIIWWWKDINFLSLFAQGGIQGQNVRRIKSCVQYPCGRRGLKWYCLFCTKLHLLLGFSLIRHWFHLRLLFFCQRYLTINAFSFYTFFYIIEWKKCWASITITVTH